MAGVARLLPELDRHHLNVKVVFATSPQLFAVQLKEYQDRVLSAGDRFDSTVLTTQARWLMHDWLFSKVSEDYAVSADWDDRWRTGGTLDEALDEAHLTPDRLLEGIERFVKERNERLARLRSDLEATR